MFHVTRYALFDASTAEGYDTMNYLSIIADKCK